MVAVMILIALVLGQLFSVGLIGAVLGPIFNAIGNILILVVYVFAVPIFWLVQTIGSLLGALMGRERQAMEFQGPINILEELEIEPGTAGLPPDLVLMIKWAGVIVVAIIGLFFLLRAINRWNEWDRSDEIAEERDSVWEEWSLKAILIAWLRALFGRFARERTQVAAPEDIMFTKPSAEPASVATIREIYRRLLRLGASLGTPRARNATPYEHLARLRELLRPDKDLTAITEAYVRTRYSPIGAEDAEIGEVQLSWQRVSSVANAELLSDGNDR
jgi:hypothetical protein